MASIGIPQIVALASALLGFICLITSSLLLDTWAEAHDNTCSVNIPSLDKVCENLEYVIAAGSFGIIAALLQMGAVSLGFMNRWTMWCILQLVVGFLSLVAFSIAIDKDVHEYAAGDADSRGKAFVAFAGIDLFFAIFAAAGVFYLTKDK